MKKFTKEMADKLNAAADALRGTFDYHRYDMAMEGKTDNGKWEFLLWCIPFREGIIKARKDKTYIVCDNGDGDLYRWEVSEAVKELLNI